MGILKAHLVSLWLRLAKKRNNAKHCIITPFKRRNNAFRNLFLKEFAYSSYFPLRQYDQLHRFIYFYSETVSVKAFNSTFRYLDDLLNIDNLYFEGMVNQIYPPELQINKANTSDTEAPFWSRGQI